MSDKIRTLVFFDIETTGLPWQERNQTKIIQLSFIAVDRSDFVKSTVSDLPAYSKLTLNFNPNRTIPRVVTSMTGLSTRKLKTAPVFKEKFQAICEFLDALPQPICLIAHNGDKFDYKILLAECVDIGKSLPHHLLCLDSLVGFRKLLQPKTSKRSSVNKKTETSADEWPDLDISTEEWQEIDSLCESLSDVSCEDVTENINKENVHKQQEKRDNAAEKIFDTKPKKEIKNNGKGCYTLSALYKRLLDKEPVNAHRAETDCLMLLECFLALKEDILQWADQNCKSLSNIQPLIRY